MCEPMEDASGDCQDSAARPSCNNLRPGSMGVYVVSSSSSQYPAESSALKIICMKK